VQSNSSIIHDGGQHLAASLSPGLNHHKHSTSECSKATYTGLQIVSLFGWLMAGAGFF
jgi:hypothetical protein